jgi:hypothetical protein
MCSRELYRTAITLLFLAKIFPEIDGFGGRFLLGNRAVFEPFVIAGEPKTNSQSFRLGKKMLFKSTWRSASTNKQLTPKT